MILTFVSPDGTSTVFSRDATDYHLLKRYGGFAEIPASFQSDKAPGQHGSTLQECLMDERDVWFDILIQAPTEGSDVTTSVFDDAIFDDMIFDNPYQLTLERLQDVIAALSAALNPLDGPGTLYYQRENGTIFRLTCSGSENTVWLDPSNRSDIHQAATVKLKAHDPFWYSGSVNRTTFAPSDAGWIPWAIPWTIPTSINVKDCLNAGTTDTNVAISIWGPIVEPIITNVTVKNGVTTTEIITTSITLAVDDRLDITTGIDNETVWLTVGAAAPVKAFSYITVGSKFWQMKKGMNRVTLSCTSSTVGCGASITWSDKYAGVF